MAITRRDIQNLGATKYQVEAITKRLTAIGVKKRAYLYDIEDVIQSIAKRRSHPKIRAKTKEFLIQLGTKLRHLAINHSQSRAVEALDKILAKGTEAMACARASLSKIESECKKIRKTLTRHNERNNIIPFQRGEWINVDS